MLLSIILRNKLFIKALHRCLNNSICKMIGTVCPSLNLISPCSFSIQSIIRHNPRIMMLCQHQCTPSLIHICLSTNIFIFQISHYRHFLCHDNSIFWNAYFLRYFLQNLTSPHKIHMYIFLWKIPVIIRFSDGDIFNVISPCHIYRVIFCVLSTSQPWAVFPSRILKTHTNGVFDTCVTAIF